MENTPFEIVGEEKQGYFAALGKYRLTEAMKTETEVEIYINKNMYNIVLQVMSILIPAEVKEELKHERNQAYADNSIAMNNRKSL